MFDNLSLRDLQDINAEHQRMLEAARQERLARLLVSQTARPNFGDRLLLFLSDKMIDAGLYLRTAVRRKRNEIVMESGYAD